MFGLGDVVPGSGTNRPQMPGQTNNLQTFNQVSLCDCLGSKINHTDTSQSWPGPMPSRILGSEEAANSRFSRGRGSPLTSSTFNPSSLAPSEMTHSNVLTTNMFTNTAFTIGGTSRAVESGSGIVDTTPGSMAESSLGSLSAQGPSPGTAFGNHFAAGASASINKAEHGQRKKRRRTAGGPSEPDADVTRRIVVANFSNETDALEILAHAATDGEGRSHDSEDGHEGSPSHGKPGDRGTSTRSDGPERLGARRRSVSSGRKKSVGWNMRDGSTDRDRSLGRHDEVFLEDGEEDDSQEREVGMEDFLLVSLGIIGIEMVEELVSVFFQQHHPVLVSCTSYEFFISKID